LEIYPNHIKQSPTVFQNGLGYTQTDSYEQAKHIGGPEKKFHFFSLPLKKPLSKCEKHISGSTKRMGNLRSAFEKADSL
jgi:hypothetical protein